MLDSTAPQRTLEIPHIEFSHSLLDFRKVDLSQSWGRRPSNTVIDLEERVPTTVLTWTEEIL